MINKMRLRRLNGDIHDTKHSYKEDQCEEKKRERRNEENFAYILCYLTIPRKYQPTTEKVGILKKTSTMYKEKLEYATAFPSCMHAFLEPH